MLPLLIGAINLNAFNKTRLDNLKIQTDSNDATANFATSIPGFECYETVEETLQAGLSLSNNFPNLTDWIDIGDSWEKTQGLGGYDLMVLKITNKSIQENKPVLFIHSSMHAREYAPAALTLDFAEHLLNHYANDADTRWILDYHEIHILFHMNPDGRKLAETSVSQRKNMNTNHCPNSVQNNLTGVDLNRNFAHWWNVTGGDGSSGDDCDQTFRGIAAESEPETIAVSNYIRSLFPDSRGENDDEAAPDTTPGMHLDIHSYSELVLWPNGHTETPSPNDNAFKALGNKLAWLNDYTPQQSTGLYFTDGTSDSVSYGELGIAALTFELGSSFFQDCNAYEATIKPDNINALYYAAKASAMPYLLPFGPEVTKISLNGAENGITVSQGTSINLEATINAGRTKLNTATKQVTRAEYSIDNPIWIDTTQPTNIEGNDGQLNGDIEVFNSTIDTSNLSLGEHILWGKRI